MTKVIGILGCGWLGLPLAKTLVGDKHSVHGTTSSENKMEELRKANIIPYNIVLTQNGIVGNIQKFLDELDQLIINIPPKLRSNPTESYLEKIRQLHLEIKKSDLSRVIFVSSTSVYGDIDGMVTEESPALPNTESGRQILASENIFLKDRDLNTTIIRFAGLIGADRHPVNYLSGKTNLTNGNDPVNLIHLNDCIGIIKTVINGKYKNRILNGVYPLHPTKEDYYTSEALKRGLLPPSYTEKSNRIGNKIIESKVLNVKIYDFRTSILR